MEKIKKFLSGEETMGPFVLDKLIKKLNKMLIEEDPGFANKVGVSKAPEQNKDHKTENAMPK